MTDDSTSPGGLADTEGTEAKPNLFEQADGVDWFLAHLIGHADSYGLEQGVALTVGGSFITGILISGRTYFSELSALMKDVASGQSNESIVNSLADGYSTFTQIYPEPDGKTLPWDRKPKYVHLRNARMVDAGGNHVPQNGMLWRGKLTDISGFSFGMIENLR